MVDIGTTDHHHGDATPGPPLRFPVARAAGTTYPAAEVSRGWMTRMLGVVRHLGAAGTLQDTLDRITEGVVEVLEFGAAAINVVHPDGSLRVDSVCGPPDLADTLLGTSGSREVWDQVLADSERWGSLYYLPRDRQPPEDQLGVWAPEGPTSDDPDAWDPDDSLFVPLHDGRGDLIGVLSVDDPRSGRRPNPEQLTLLELFAAEAANALAEAMRSASLRDREVVFRQVFNEAPAPMVVTDSSLDVLWANEAFCQLLGVRASDVAPGTLGSVVAPSDLPAFEAACAGVGDGRTPDPLIVEHRLVRADREQRWVRSSISRIETESAWVRLIIRMEDTTDDRRVLEELRRLADHDALTGLPNRRIARRRLEHLLAGGGAGRPVAVFYCDLDGFKAVNDRWGHRAGDELLTLAAARLGRVVRPPDLLCREGGDEFVVVAALGPEADPGAIAQRCIDALGAPFALREGPVSVSMSIGIATTVGRSPTVDQLMREADAALYRAKEAGRSRWATLDSSP